MSAGPTPGRNWFYEHFMESLMARYSFVAGILVSTFWGKKESKKITAKLTHFVSAKIVGVQMYDSECLLESWY